MKQYLEESMAIPEKIYETNGAEETFEVGMRLAKEAKAGDIYCLDGDLGTGKTVFSQGFAAGLGIKEAVNSPTFTIVYRIEEPEEMEEIGYEEYFYGQGVCLVEWASLVEEIIPPEAVWITIEKDLDKGFDYRKITVRGK